MSFLFDLFYSALSSLGLYYKDAKILFLGLDNSGKSTLLYMLKEGCVKSLEPTLHPGQSELIVGRCKMKVFDLGGHETARRLWGEYLATTVDGVVFLVDAVDRERLVEAQKELQALLSLDELSDVPFLVLGNKIDVPTACSEEELTYSLGLENHCYADNKNGGDEEEEFVRPVRLEMCSVIHRSGYQKGMNWLSDLLSEIE